VTPLQTEVAEREEQKPRITNELGGTLAPPQVASFDWREAPLLPGSAATGMAVASPQPTPDAEPPVALPFVVKPRANHHSVSVTAAALGNLTVGRSAVSVETVAGTALGDAQTVSESSAPGALVSVETPVFRMISLRLDGAIHTSRYTYTAGNFTSSTTSNSFFQTGGIQERQVEFTPSAVLTVPTSGRISPYVQLGGGMLVFAPHDNPNMAIHRAYRSTGLVGGGAKIHLTDHLDLTAGYRGVIYRTPEISYGYIKQASINESFPVLVRRTLSSQPFLGLTYTFGKGRNN
jgi:opacity protein-like surface antigen